LPSLRVCPAPKDALPYLGATGMLVALNRPWRPPMKKFAHLAALIFLPALMPGQVLTSYQAKADTALAKYEAACAKAADAYKAAIARAKADVAAELQAALAAATKAGDLTSANALKAKAEEVAGTTPADAPSTIDQALVGTRWTWIDSKSIISLDGGTFHGMSRSDGCVGRWRVSAPNTIELWMGSVNQRHVLTFSPDGKSFASKRDDGAGASGILVAGPAAK
jgi:hypothetical protein